MFKHDVFYTMDGFECHTQIEAQDSQEAADLLTTFIVGLRDNGGQSRIQSRAARASRTQQETEPLAPAREEVPKCPVHGKSKVGLNGNLYCPTKLEDGSWCKWTAPAIGRSQGRSTT